MRRTAMTVLVLGVLALAPAVARAAAVPAAAADGRGLRVVGGADVVDGVWPSMAALVAAGIPQAFDGQFCGGTVIAPQAVLTAAHCVVQDVRRPGAVEVLVGRSELNGKGGQRVAVTAIVPHPQAQVDPVVRYDAAVLLLAEPVAAAPIRLATAADAAVLDVPGETASVVGWGAVSRDEQAFPARLQSAWVPLLDDATCALRLAPIPFDAPATICAGSEAGEADACVGDSGGPLARTDSAGGWVQLGIVSWGLAGGCGLALAPSAYTDVASVSAWALQVASGEDAAPAPGAPGAPPSPPAPAVDPVVPTPVTPAVAPAANRPPTVRALAAQGRRDQVVRLRYRVADDGDWTRQVVTVYAPDGVLRARLTTAWRQVRPGRTASVEWLVPPRFRRGPGTFCVEAQDQGGASGRACARVRVR